MNQTASTLGSSPSSGVIGTVSTLTTVHLALIAVLALVVLVAIVYGARLKSRRRAAEVRVEEHAQDAGVVAAPPPPAGSADVPVPTPPLADAAAPGPSEAPLADEPIAASTSLEASPQREAASIPGGSSDAADAPVTQLKGLGPKIATRLGELGITSVGQLAALDDDAAARLDAQLGPFSGRLERDRWIEQARFLAAGDRPGFEAVFGRL